MDMSRGERTARPLGRPFRDGGFVGLGTLVQAAGLLIVLGAVLVLFPEARPLAARLARLLLDLAEALLGLGGNLGSAVGMDGLLRQGADR